MKKNLKQKYEQCEKCEENKTLQATPHNEISSKDIFKILIPGQRLEIYYAERNNPNYLIIVDIVTGFMQAYRTPKKSTNEAYGVRQVYGVCLMK